MLSPDVIQPPRDNLSKITAYQYSSWDLYHLVNVLIKDAKILLKC